MNGVLIVGIIVCLVFCIGLGFGILTLQEKIDDICRELNDYTAYSIHSSFVNEVANHFAELNNETKVLSNNVSSIRADFAKVKRDVYGTASEPEFCHMKTMVTQMLPNRIKRLEDVLGIHDETEITYDGLVPHREEK